MAKSKPPVDNSKKAAAHYDDVVSVEGHNLNSLMRAVKAAQDKKAAARPVAKREIAKQKRQEREVAELAKKQEQQRQDAQKLLDQQIERAKQDQSAEQDRLRREQTRERRMASVRAGRQRIESNVNRFKGLLLSFESQLRLAQMGVVNDQKIRELKQLYTSVVSAFNVLPAKLQYAADRDRIESNNDILGDLIAINEDQKNPASPSAPPQPNPKLPGQPAPNSPQPSTSNVPKQKRDWETLALSAAANLRGGLGRAARMGRRLWDDKIAGRAEAYANNARVIGGWAAAPITVPIKLVKKSIEAIGDRFDKVKDYFDPYFEKFGKMFRGLYGFIRKPLDLGKKGLGIFGDMLGWGALLTSVIAPLLKGVNDYLEEQYGKNYIQDFVSKKFDEAKTWLLDNFTKWFETFFDWGKKKGGELVEGVKKGAEYTGNVASQMFGDRSKIPPEKQIFTPGGLNKSNEAVQSIVDSYNDWKTANIVTRPYYAMKLKMGLPFTSVAALPPDVKEGLIKDGFLSPKAEAQQAATEAKVPKSAPMVAPTTGGGGRISAATMAAPPMDGKAASSPVFAVPGTSAKGGESSKSKSSSTGTPGGVSVGQIPHHAVGEAAVALNIGVFG